jgi:hypothetical protein
MIPMIAQKRMSAETWETVKTNLLGEDHIKEVRVKMLKSEFDKLQTKDTETIHEFTLRMKTLTNEIYL